MEKNAKVIGTDGSDTVELWVRGADQQSLETVLEIVKRHEGSSHECPCSDEARMFHITLPFGACGDETALAFLRKILWRNGFQMIN